MRLADFILSNIENILLDWVEFAKTKISVGRGMTDLALRNDADAILREVARDMVTHQSALGQKGKSEGTPSSDVLHDHTLAHSHAVQRARSGFEVNQMVSEFRALRATVLRLWAEDAGSANLEDLVDVTRFNEAIDEALADSLKHFVREVDRARSLFLGTLGHDLRTPLSTISNCAAAISKNHPDASREAEMIRRSTERMRELVGAVLSYTRRSLGALLPLEVKPMRLDEVVRDCVRELAVSNTGREISLSISGDMQGAWDPARLAQLTSNLIGNALKYGEQSQPVQVTLDGSAVDEVTLRVQNFGVPIEGDLLSDIFEPLVRGPSAPGHEHTEGADLGLGLYIVREVVTAHGGSVHAASDQTKGTVFEVRLPRTLASDA